MIAAPTMPLRWGGMWQNLLLPERLLARYHDVMEDVARAAREVGRAPESVRVLVVSKQQPVESLRVLAAAGHRDFGENRAEEAAAKSLQLRREGFSVCWHFIGNIQSRKAAAVVAHCDWIHSVDRVSVARVLQKRAESVGKTPSILLECNVSGEATKSGFSLVESLAQPRFPSPVLWESLIHAVAEIRSCPNLHLHGLMTMAPAAGSARGVFDRLARVRAMLATEFPDTDWRELSMGMSGDYREAIAAGATWIRIGTAIFGGE